LLQPHQNEDERLERSHTKTKMDSGGESHLAHLPSEVVARVFRWLDPFSLARCEAVCLSWRGVLAPAQAGCSSGAHSWIWRKAPPSLLWRDIYFLFSLFIYLISYFIHDQVHESHYAGPDVASGGPLLDWRKMCRNAARAYRHHANPARALPRVERLQQALAFAIERHHNVVVAQLLSGRFPGGDGGGDEGALPLEELLERTAVAPSFNRQSGQPPLNVAARSGNERATVMLLEKGLSVTSTTVKLAIQNTTRTAYTLLLRLLEHTAGGQVRDASSLEQALSPLCLSTSSLFFLAGTALLLGSCRARARVRYPVVGYCVLDTDSWWGAA
jgi:hypothetical protein